MLSFVVILITAFAAFFGTPWWIIAVSATLISIASIGEHRLSRQHLASLPLGAAVAREAIAYSIAHASAAASAAYVLGAATRLIVAT